MKSYTLYCGDCLKVMPQHVPDESIDLTVTSPPYDNLRDYGKDFDAAIFDWRPIIRELYRVTKSGGVVVWVVADATIKGSETGTSFRQALYAMKCGFSLYDTMIYRRQAAFPSMDTKNSIYLRYNQDYEFMFIFTKGQKPAAFNAIMDKPNKYAGEKITGTDRCRNGEIRQAAGAAAGRKYKNFGIRSNIWDIQSGFGQSGDPLMHMHPATFPEQLANDHILSWSNPGAVVCDPMMGSGTTGKMAIKNGRKFIGIELDAGYFEIAETRIKNVAGDFTRTPAEKEKGQLALWQVTP